MSPRAWVLSHYLASAMPGWQMLLMMQLGVWMVLKAVGLSVPEDSTMEECYWS